MISIHRIYINALLADATYAIKEKDRNGLIGEDMKTHKGINKRMTPIIADYMGKHFSVITSINANDFPLSADTGFDATVWR